MEGGRSQEKAKGKTESILRALYIASQHVFVRFKSNLTMGFFCYSYF